MTLCTTSTLVLEEEEGVAWEGFPLNSLGWHQPWSPLKMKKIKWQQYCGHRRLEKPIFPPSRQALQQGPELPLIPAMGSVWRPCGRDKGCSLCHDTVALCSKQEPTPSHTWVSSQHFLSPKPHAAGWPPALHPFPSSAVTSTGQCASHLLAASDFSCWKHQSLMSGVPWPSLDS